MELPENLKPYLGEYQACLYDSYCGEPVAWGYPVLRYLGEDLWAEAHKCGTMECSHSGYPPRWYLIVKRLTPNEAKEKYGEVKNLEEGPRGGFRSVTYGEKKFLSKHLDPR